MTLVRVAMYAYDIYVVNNRGSFQCHILIVLEIKSCLGMRLAASI